MRWSTVWTRVVAVFDALTFSPTPHDGAIEQLPILPVPTDVGMIPDVQGDLPKGPEFRPPSHGDDDFKCEYPAMRNWKPCSSAKDRGCWLRHRDGRRIDILSDYENERLAPTGITRKYFLNLTDGEVNADGTPMKDAKLFNGTYPGPWIQACWGDELEITVLNSMKKSKQGSTIHWHGIRQLNSVSMDGVNGITQCPIAPGSEFTYKFKALQYGSSWYHSHYSLQYADGLVGPYVDQYASLAAMY